MMILSLTVFSMMMLSWLAGNGVQDGKLHLLLAEGFLWLLFGLALIYVAGATTQDIIALVTAVKGGAIAARSATATQVTHTETTEVRKDKREVT